MKKLFLLSFLTICAIFYGATKTTVNNLSENVAISAMAPTQNGFARVCGKRLRPRQLPVCPRCRPLTRGQKCGGCRTGNAAFRCIVSDQQHRTFLEEPNARRRGDK